MDEKESLEFRIQEGEKIARKILKAVIQKRTIVENAGGIYIKINTLLHHFPTDECIITYRSQKPAGLKEERILFGRAYCVQTPHNQKETPEEEFNPLTTSDRLITNLPIYVFYFEKGEQFSPSIKNKIPPLFKFETEGEIDPKMARILEMLAPKNK